MCQKLMMLGATLLMFGCMALAADKAFMGVVSDSHCGAKHSTAGDDVAACGGKCVAGGATYVLAASDGKDYQLDKQEKFKGYAGKSVKRKGTSKVRSNCGGASRAGGARDHPPLNI